MTEVIRSSEIVGLADYEKVRESTRARVIALKAHRRISVGPSLTFLFENRETVLFQIQEMLRTERIVDPAKVQDEIDAYNPLLPSPCELSATLFIEIPDLVTLGREEVRARVNQFQGIDREGVTLRIGEAVIPARFEPGHSKEEKMAAVHYLRFEVGGRARDALADLRVAARLRVDHDRYQAEAAISPALRGEMLADLA
jgi:hypothetical protein